jgi:hypothetical protein
MKNIKNFEQFNEGFFSKIKKALTPTKKLNSIYDKQLNMYNLKTSVLNDGQEVNITHGDKLVGKLESNSSEKLKWGLTFYYYESETPSEGKKYKKPEEIEGQKEQPYAVGKMRFANSDKAIMTFCRWWEANTKSGVKKNPENKVNTK